MSSLSNGRFVFEGQQQEEEEQVEAKVTLAAAAAGSSSSTTTEAAAVVVQEEEEEEEEEEQEEDDMQLAWEIFETARFIYAEMSEKEGMDSEYKKEALIKLAEIHCFLGQISMESGKEGEEKKRDNWKCHERLALVLTEILFYITLFSLFIASFLSLSLTYFLMFSCRKLVCCH